jgi:hypothetical protein
MKWLLTFLLSMFVLYSCEDQTQGDLKSVNYFQLSSIQKAIVTNDNGFLIGGIDNQKITFIKTDENFQTSWGKNDYDWGHMVPGIMGSFMYWVQIVNIFQDDFGNYTVIGQVEQGGCVVFGSTLIVELSHTGTQLKKMEIPDSYVYNAIKTADGGFLLSGYSLLKLDKNFKKEWEKVLAFPEFAVIQAKCLANGKIALSCNNNGDTTSLKIINENGDELEDLKFAFSDNSFNELGYDMYQLHDDGFIIAGRTRNVTGTFDMDCGVMRLDEKGNKVWSKKFGSSSEEWFENIIYSSEDDFVAEGSIGYPGDKNQKTILMRMSTDGQVLDSLAIDKVAALLYSPHKYFVKASKLDGSNVMLSKIPFNELFSQSSK